MGFDIKAKIDEVIKKVKGDPKLMDKFQKDPEKTIEDVAGVDIPDGQLDAVVTGVKAKLTGDKLSGIADKIGGIFKK